MSAAYKKHIRFGYLQIPVGLHPAVKEHDIHFHFLCKDDHSRIRFHKCCTECGKDLHKDDIVKGYEYEENQYAIVEETEFESIKTPRNQVLEIQQFILPHTIPAVYYEKTYHLIPDPDGLEAFSLLHKAMKEENKVALAVTLLGRKEKLMALIPHDTGILGAILYFADEIQQAPAEFSPDGPVTQELQLAKALMSYMTKPFQPADYEDGYQNRLKELLEAKIKGEEPIFTQEPPLPEIQSISDALQQSLDQMKRSKAP